MGYSEAPDPAVLRPTFDDVASVVDEFIAQRASGPLILYLHDIGGPTLRYFDGGHFVLDEHANPIAEAIIETFSR